MKEPSRAEQDIETRVARRHTAEAALSLDVTLLGDGRGTPEYGKRLELQERLERHRFVSRVTLPEQLHDAYPQATVDEVERSAIEQADVVLCIESPFRPPLGLYTEVVAYFDGSDPDKWYRCRPTERVDSSGADSLIARLAEAPFRRMDTFVYDPEEWETCGRITKVCEERIELVAHRVLRRQFGLPF